VSRHRGETKERQWLPQEVRGEEPPHLRPQRQVMFLVFVPSTLGCIEGFYAEK
jgi:hypothetical protein